MSDPDIQLHPSLPCQMCGGELLFAVQISVREDWSGQSIAGYRTATLCPHCHRNDPAAQGVLAYFTVHERITEDTLHDAAPVIRQWLDHVVANPPVYTDEELDEDIRRWEFGDM
ncbi:MAG: DUF6300 family protein [Sciscionella sp.]